MRLSMLMVLLTLVSCGGGNGGGGNGTNATSPVQQPQTQSEDVTVSENATFELELKRKTELNDERTNLEEFKKDINTHLVKVRALTGNYKGSVVVCEKTHFDGTKTKYANSFDGKGLTAKVEIQLKENDPALVNYDCSIKHDGQELDHIDVKILKSFVVSDKKNYADFIAAPSIGTLLIDKNGELSTDGIDLELKVKDLISLKGKLVTFPAERVTSDNRPGFSGGKITLEAEKATGDLIVELRGLNGGKQANIPEKIVAVPPANPAKDGQCRNGTPRSSSDQRCMGKQGDKGYPGKPGFPGFAGGDTGALVFTSIKKSDINLEVKYFPGLGSLGTPGSEGGIGGPGGRGNIVTWHEPKDVGPRCPMCSPNDDLDNSNLMTGGRIPFKDGAQGPKGDTGEKGADGANGRILESKVIFTEEAMEFNFYYDWKNFN